MSQLKWREVYITKGKKKHVIQFMDENYQHERVKFELLHIAIVYDHQTERAVVFRFLPFS